MRVRATSKRMVFLICFCVAQAHTFFSTASAQEKGSKKQKPLVYDAVVMQTSGIQPRRAHLLYSNGKFREELYALKPPSSTKAPDTIQGCTLFDRSKPYVIWGYDPKQHIAWPDLPAIQYAIDKAVRERGETEVRKEYHIPPHYPLSHSSTPEAMLHPTMQVSTKASMGSVPWKPQGHERIAGRMCDVFEYQQHIPTMRAADSPKSTRTERIWVEPGTNLVFKYEQREEPAPGSQMPPSRFTFAVENIHFLSYIAPDRFQLPAGATAHIPRIFAGVSLPPGVHRVTATGPYADTGIDLTGAH